jgi:hypothetical protein
MTTDWLFKPITISRGTILLMVFIGLLLVAAIGIWLWYDWHFAVMQSEIQTLKTQQP